ncbi:MAG: WD40/YVTN/BNR-like repeat-containing protein [Candidatus Limnocylindrales bacterium]
MRQSSMLRFALVVVLVVAGCATSPPAVSSPSSPSAVRPSPPSPNPTASGTAAAAASASPLASVGTTPNVVRTLDATVAEHPLAPALFAVAFVDRWTGWAAGSGIILGTTDGGATWRSQWSGSRLILSLSVVDRLHAWGLGYANQQSAADRLVRTDDGGRTWTAATLSGGFRAIAFATDRIGWAVVGGISATTSDPGHLESTLDGGLHWRTTSLTAGVDSVCFASPSIGWAAHGSAVYRTLDGGRAWTKVARGPNDALNSGWHATVSCSGTSAWVLSTGGGAAGSEAYRVTRTLDGGAHWATVLAGLDDALPTLPGIDAYAGPFTAVGAGSAGFVGWCPACGAGTWSYTRTNDGGRTVSRAPLAGLTGATVADITFVDATHGWIAGAAAGGFLLATDDGGRTWRRAYPSTALRPALDVAFVSAQIGFGLGIIGDARAILRTGDGGQNWRAIGRLPADPAWLDVDPILWFVDPSHGWVATLRGLLATTDGGATWQSVPGAPPGGVAFADAEHGCAGSFFAPATATTDGGRTWSPIAADRGVVVCACSLVDPAWIAAAGPFDPGSLLAIAAIVDPTHGWALGLLDTGVTGLAATSDGGATWTAYRWPSPPNGTGGFSLDDITRLSFVSPTTGWAFTLFGRLFETQDGGTSWQEIEPR